MPDEISVAVNVTRQTLSMDALELEADGAFHIVAIGAGGHVWRRTTVEGPFQHGRLLLGAVLDTAVLTGIVRVYGANWQEVRTNAQLMFDAFSQMRYLVVVNIEDVLDVYVCEPADVVPVGGDAWQKPQLFAAMQEYQFSAPILVGGQS